MNLYAIGENIRNLRKKASLTQEELASKLNVSPQAVSKWENGHCLPETQLLPSLSKFLFVSIDQLLIVEDSGNLSKLKNQTSIIIEPKIIRKGQITILGVLGDGSQTHMLWTEFERLSGIHSINDQVEEAGYELRLHDGSGDCQCLTGVRVKGPVKSSVYQYKELPDVLYAAFEIYPAMGYESQNDAIKKWMINNKDKYQEFKMDKLQYVIEYYDERFKGNEDPNSIVEIWIPVIKI